MEIAIYKQTGASAGKMTLSDAIFGLPMNADLLAQALRVLEARSRRTIAHTKRRGDVRGGGRKPWRQKGTGRARHGSIRSPLWRGGGVTFGPIKDRNFSLSMPKSMRQRAFAVALSAKVADHELAIIDVLKLEEGKTKAMATVLGAVSKAAFGDDAQNATMMIVTGKRDEQVLRASRNLQKVSYRSATTLSTTDVITPRFLLMTKDAIATLEKRMEKKESGPKKIESVSGAKKKKTTTPTAKKKVAAKA